MSIYHNDDLGFDLEIRGNFFVNTQIYPSQKKIIVSFLEEMDETDYPELKPHAKPESTTVHSTNPLLNDQDDSRLAQQTTTTEDQDEPTTPKKWHHGLMQKYYNNGPDDYQVQTIEDVKNYVIERIRKVVETVSEYSIEFENLAQLDDFKTFAKRYGINSKKKLMNNTHAKNAIYKPYNVVYDTDDIYNPDQHGLRIGYNSINYDETMIAYLLGDLSGKMIIQAIKSDPENELFDAANKVKANKKLHQIYYDQIINANGKNNAYIHPGELAEFNNRMFAQEYGMSSALGRPWDNTLGINTYNAWNRSNRFVDVSALNPMRISLKRCAMAMGYKIQESESNREPTAPITTIDDLADLIAYNVNDVYVTLKLFESGAYINRFKQNQQLLKEFPYLIYEQTKAAQEPNAKQKIQYDTGQDHIRNKRLTVNDTSTKFVTNAIAPYPNTKIQDNQTLNLNYPDETLAQQMAEANELPHADFFNGHSKNVLDYIQYLLDADKKEHQLDESLANKVQAQYDHIRKFYEQYIGKNFNDELDEVPYTNPRTLPQNHVIVRYINPDGNFMDEHGIELGSYINLSIGGTHGVEARQGIYDQDVSEYHQKQTELTNLINFFNHSQKVKERFGKVNLDNLANVIAEIKPDEPFTHIKKMPLPTNENLTFDDILTSSASRKNPRLRKIKEPKLFTGAKLDKKYSYTSSDPSVHQDFDSYYPSLIDKLKIFRNVDGNDIFTSDLYHPRLKMKALAKDKSIDGEQRASYQLRQLSMKLLINAASGGGDATFKSNIKCNNKMLAMRIIGQLFCWYIGQSLALHGARIPSTNTDGLYAMSLDESINDSIVEECAANLMLKIDPEKIDLFVSKDANNRLESNHHQVDEARGGALTSWQGPGTQNSIAHPAIIDYVLAQYLATKHDAVNQDFDFDYAKSIFENFLTHEVVNAYGKPLNATVTDKLRFLQFPLSGNAKTGKYFYKQEISPKDENGEPTKSENQLQFSLLNNTNRIFLVKNGTSPYTVKMTGLQVVQTNSVKTRLKEKLGLDKVTAAMLQSNGYSFKDIIEDYNDPIAQQVLQANASDRFYNGLFDQEYDPHATESANKPRDIIVNKISDLRNDQPVKLYNEDLHFVTQNEYDHLIQDLDIDEYIAITQNKFEKQWRN